MKQKPDIVDLICMKHLDGQSRALFYIPDAIVQRQRFGTTLESLQEVSAMYGLIVYLRACESDLHASMERYKLQMQYTRPLCTE